MLRLLIVDDEKNTREGIERCIDWGAMGVTIVGKAGNGIEALELAQKHNPDLIITDVCMPKMDGIALVSKLRELNRETRVIFISGYTDLEYLKSAYKYEVVDYLLKPVDIEELETVVNKVVVSYREEQEKLVCQQDMEQRLRESMPYLREKFLCSLLSDENENQNEIEERLKFLNISLPLSGCYVACIISIEDATAIFDICSPKDRQLMSFTIQNVIQEIIERYANGFVVEWSVKEYVCALLLPENGAEAEKCVKTICEEIYDSLNRYMSIRNTIGVGRKESGLYGLSKSFHSAQEALSRRIVLGSNVIIYAGRNDAAATDMFLLPQVFYERLANAILNGDADHAKNLLQEVFDILRETEREDELYFRNGCLLIASYIVSAFGRLEIRDSDIIGKISNLHQEVLRLNTLKSIQELFLDMITIVCEHTRKHYKTKKAVLVGDVKKLIQTRYKEKLSIEEIAKTVYLSPAYLCLLFKEETGQTINEYLTQMRMEKAKSLLCTGERKVLEVALEVGYQDQKYFCKLFKKYTGVNPSEYR